MLAQLSLTEFFAVAVALGSFFVSSLALYNAKPAPAKLAAPNVAEIELGRRVTLTADESGRFYADISVNGVIVKALIDTGNAFTVLTWEDARRIGLKLERSDFRQPMVTAANAVTVAPVLLAMVDIRGIRVRNVAALVTPPGYPSKTVLGVNALERLGRVVLSQNRLTLVE